MSNFPQDVFSLFVGVAVFILVILVVLICAKVIPVKVASGFAGKPASEYWNNNSGASLRMQGTGFSQGYNQDGWKEGMITGNNRRQSFLGGPESPVFYDIGDINMTRETVMASKDDDSEDGPLGAQAKVLYDAAGNRQVIRSREGFARDQINSANLNPY